MDSQTINRMKPDLAKQFAESELPEYKGKWRNVYPLKDGRVHHGSFLYDNSVAARRASIEWFALPGAVTHSTDGKIPISLFRGYAIQIPVKG